MGRVSRWATVATIFIVVSFVLIPNARAVVTLTIAELHYPDKIIYNTNEGTMEPTPQVEVTVSYAFAIRGYWIAIGIYDADVLSRYSARPLAQRTWPSSVVSGNATCDPLQNHWKSRTPICMIQLPEGNLGWLNGSERATFLLMNLQTRTYHLGVGAEVDLQEGLAGLPGEGPPLGGGAAVEEVLQAFSIDVVSESVQTTSTGTTASTSQTMVTAGITTTTPTEVTTISTQSETTVTVTNTAPESYFVLTPVAIVAAGAIIALALLVGMRRRPAERP